MEMWAPVFWGALLAFWAGGHWASLTLRETVSDRMGDFAQDPTDVWERGGWPRNKYDFHECEAQADHIFLFRRVVLYAMNAPVIRNDITSRLIGAGETSGARR